MAALYRAEHDRAGLAGRVAVAGSAVDYAGHAGLDLDYSFLNLRMHICIIVL